MEHFLEAHEIPADATFVKSGRSGAAGHCVEVAAIDRGVALRHSKAPQRGAFVFDRDEFAAFVDGARDGDFNHLIK